MFKKIWKKLLVGLLVPLILAMMVGVGVGVWYFLIRETPKSVLNSAVTAARQRNVDAFKFRFSSSSVRALEGSWAGDTRGQGGSWISMMEGLLEPNGAPPQVVKEKVAEERALIKVRLRNKNQTIFLTKDDGDWKIDVLSGIQAGLSEEARKAPKAVKKDGDKAKKEDELFSEPKKEGWWKE